MPIRPENLLRYPADWPTISWTIRWIRALGQCECQGECADVPTWHGAHRYARCGAVNGKPHPRTRSTVVLTVAHLDHTPEHVHPANLRAMCQACHLRYDRDHHAETRRETRERQLVAAAHGVWAREGGARFWHPVAHSTVDALSDETVSVVPASTPEPSEAAETISGGAA